MPEQAAQPCLAAGEGVARCGPAAEEGGAWTMEKGHRSGWAHALEAATSNCGLGKSLHGRYRQAGHALLAIL